MWLTYYEVYKLLRTGRPKWLKWAFQSSIQHHRSRSRWFAWNRILRKGRVDKLGKRGDRRFWQGVANRELGLGFGSTGRSGCTTVRMNINYKFTLRSLNWDLRVEKGGLLREFLSIDNSLHGACWVIDFSILKNEEAIIDNTVHGVGAINATQEWGSIEETEWELLSKSKLFINTSILLHLVNFIVEGLLFSEADWLVSSRAQLGSSLRFNVVLTLLNLVCLEIKNVNTVNLMSEI